VTTGTGVGVEVTRKPSIRGTMSAPAPKNNRVKQQQRESTIATTIAMIERSFKATFLSIMVRPTRRPAAAYYSRKVTKGNAHT
jgi:hypothetical protein